MPNILPNDEIPVLNPKLSPLQLYKGPEHLVRGSESDLAEAFKTLEDGRMYFAVDTKKIYVDCDFETSDGQLVQDRLSFGGNGGIFYGNKDFSEDETGESRYEFWLEIGDLEKLDEIPCIDDLILNKDGCFYRVVDIDKRHTETYETSETGEIIVIESEEEYTVIITEKLTIAGSGGGGGEGTTSIMVKKDNTKSLSFISAAKYMPLYLYVQDTQADTSIDIYATVQGQALNNGEAIKTNVPQGEWFILDLYRYETYFSRSAPNRVVLTFRNEYNRHATLTVAPVQLVDLQLTTPSQQLPTQKQPNFNINLYPYGVGSMDHWEIYSTLHFPNGQANDLTTHYAPPQDIRAGDYFQYAVNLAAYSTGDYSYDFWIRAWPQGYEDENDYLESKPISVDFIYQNQNASTPYLQFGLDDKNQRNYTLNSIIPMHYSVSFRDSGSVAVRRDVYLNGARIASNNATISYDEQYSWEYLTEAAGSYEFVIYIEAFNISATTGLVTVEEGENELPVIDPKMASLQLYLKASGKSNTDDDRDTWSYQYGTQTITGQLKGFNWSTNGWRTVDGAPALHLSNGARLEVPYQVFGRNAFATGKTIEIDFKLSNIRDVNAVWLDMASWRINDNKLNCGIVATGDKICINTRQKINYRTPEEDLALSEDDRAATNGQRAYIAEDARIHVTFTMEDNSEGNNNLIYTYVNGVMSGAIRHTPTDTIEDDLEVDENNPINRKSFIRIDSTYADIDIYSIRIYSQFFGDNLVLNNYIADLPTLAEKERVYRENQALTSDGRNISLSLVRNLRNIPYGVIIDHGSTSDKKAKEGITDTSTRGFTPNTKEDFHLVDFYYVDPDDESRNIGVTYGANGDQILNPVPAVIYAQGTSSLQYPVKNLRMRFVNKGDKYSLKPAIPVGANEDAATVAERWAHLPPVALFTFKTDYMDSSMSHNTGIGNILSALYQSVNLKTPAQEYYSDQTIVNNILGTPCILFYRADDDTTTDPQFIGRYNFDLDKDSKDDSVLFGLTPDKAGRFGVLTDDQGNLKWGFIGTTDEEYDESKTYYTKPILGPNGQPSETYKYNGGADGWKTQTYRLGPLYEWVEGPSTIQCWEFLNNPSNLCKFHTEWDEAADLELEWTKTSKGKTKTFTMKEWCESFESRYPAYDTEVMADKRAWNRVVTWLASTNQATATNAALPQETYGFTTDSKEYRLEKFKREFNNYFVREFCSFYYVLTESLLMVDSRGKNMMMACFDADPDNPDETKRGHWMPWFYDMDTSLGVDNSGVLKFPYDTDDDTEGYAFNAKANYGEYDADNNWIPHDDYSTLWANFREAFFEDISSMYNQLRSKGKLTYDYISRSLDKSLATRFAEIYDNMDAKWKFIRPLTEETTVMDPTSGEMVTKTGVDWIQATQGTRELHRKHFLNHRFAMLDSKYPRYAEGGKDTGITLRLEGTQTQFELTSSSTQYGVVYVGGNMPTVKLLPDKPTWTAPTTMASVSNLETYIWNLGDIYDIGNLAQMKPSTLDFPVKNKLRSIKLGQTEVARETFWTKNCNLGSLNNVPLLELLDLRNVKLTNPAVNAITNAYLRDVYAKGSNVTSFTFIHGGTLRHIELPASFNSLYIAGHLTLDTINNPDNIQFEDITALENLAIEDSPNIDTLSIVNELMANNVTLSHIRLPDIEWTIVPSAETCEFDSEGHIIDIKVLHYVSRFPGLSAPKADGSYEQTYSQQGNLFFAGHVKIENGTGANGIGVDTYTINDKYALVYPQLHIDYDSNPNNIEGYRINVHPAGSMAGSQELVTYNRETGRENSTVKSAAGVLALDWRDYLENHIDYPAKGKDGQWIYTFKGWNYTSSVMSDDDNEVNAALDIPITTVNETGMDASAAATNLTLEQFGDDNTLDLFPVYKKTLRQFLVRFYNVALEDYVAPAGETPDTPVLDDPQINAYYYVTWGERTPVPDNEPSVITLDPDDKTKATVKRLQAYDESPGPISRITSNAQYFPIWRPAQDMSTLTNPTESYFEPIAAPMGFPYSTIVADCYVPDNCVVAKIKSSFTGEAIVVPLQLGGKRVVSIMNESTTVRRIFFEKGNVSKIVGPREQSNTLVDSSNILYIVGGTSAGFSLPTFSALTETTAVNTTLEYIEFSACKQLKMIGSSMTGGTGEFAGCVNLYVPELPDSLEFIGTDAFRACPEVCFTKMPRSISVIGQYAFRKCTGLEFVDASDIQPAFTPTSIRQGAFNLCTNLTFGDSYSFATWHEIYSQAFAGCTNLKAWADRNNLSNTTTFIGSQAFMNCPNLDIKEIPTNCTTIQDQAFALKGTGKKVLESPVAIGLTGFAPALVNIGSQVFYGCKLEQLNGQAINWDLNIYNDYANIADDALDGLWADELRMDNIRGADASQISWLNYNATTDRYSFDSNGAFSNLPFGAYTWKDKIDPDTHLPVTDPITGEVEREMVPTPVHITNQPDD